MASTTLYHVFLAYHVLCKRIFQVLKLFFKLKTEKKKKKGGLGGEEKKRKNRELFSGKYSLSIW